MTPQLPGVLGSLAPLLERYGYLAVVGLVFVEGFGLPAPGQTILVVAGVYAGAGHLDIVFVALCGFFAATIGDNIGYLIGKAGGRRLVRRFGRYIFLTPERLDKAETFFARHGGEKKHEQTGLLARRVPELARLIWIDFTDHKPVGSFQRISRWLAVVHLRF